MLLMVFSFRKYVETVCASGDTRGTYRHAREIKPVIEATQRIAWGRALRAGPGYGIGGSRVMALEADGRAGIV